MDCFSWFSLHNPRCYWIKGRQLVGFFWLRLQMEKYIILKAQCANFIICVIPSDNGDQDWAVTKRRIFVLLSGFGVNTVWVSYCLHTRSLQALVWNANHKAANTNLHHRKKLCYFIFIVLFLLTEEYSKNNCISIWYLKKASVPLYEVRRPQGLLMLLWLFWTCILLATCIRKNYLK